jgi:epoxyqueuosine reductase
MLKAKEIKELVYSLGFDACGITPAIELEDEIKKKYEEWLGQGYYGEMNYLAQNVEKRINPAFLVPNAKTIIVVLLNYYPPEKQDENIPKVAKCAYGRDYHKVVKKKLKKVFSILKEKYPGLEGRFFSDSAPVMERIWAVRSGLGWIGKNNLLINKKLGSFFYIGELIINQEVDEYDKPMEASHCGNCTRCIDACPTKALSPYNLNATRCISYDTIELKDEAKSELTHTYGWIFGCDICQDVCPWNSKLIPTSEEDLFIKPFLKKATASDWEELTEEEFEKIFFNSQLKRAGLKKIKLNLKKAGF